MAAMNDEVLYDKRLVERHIRRGLLSREDVVKRLESSDDLAQQADVIDVEAMQAEIESSTAKKAIDRHS